MALSNTAMQSSPVSCDATRMRRIALCTSSQSNVSKVFRSNVT